MVRLAVIAHPGSRTERISLVDAGTLAVWVRARPVEGQANAAVVRAVATSLGLRPYQVKIVGGLANRRKIVEIDLPGADALHERLVAYGLRLD